MYTQIVLGLLAIPFHGHEAELNHSLQDLQSWSGFFRELHFISLSLLVTWYRLPTSQVFLLLVFTPPHTTPPHIFPWDKKLHYSFSKFSRVRINFSWVLVQVKIMLWAYIKWLLLPSPCRNQICSPWKNLFSLLK